MVAINKKVYFGKKILNVHVEGVEQLPRPQSQHSKHVHMWRKGQLHEEVFNSPTTP